MANSSFYKNTGTSSQLQGSVSASAAAALASEQAALASENAAQASETNAAASAAAALVSKNAAASSAASANSDALAASISATASQTAATSSSANAALTSADATATASDRVQTGLDRVATSADAVQTAADRVQTGLDVTSTGASAAAALSSRNAAATSETNAAASAASSSADATATASDRVQTGLDSASTAADAIATAADRVQTGLDATSASNSASAASSSASAAASDATAAAASAASAANSYDLFDDRYLGSKTGYITAQTGPALDNDGNALVAGTLFFSADANEMRVYDGAGWIAASSAGSSSLINYHYTATASQTAFSGSDDNSNTLSYTVDNLIVTKNGIVLEDGTDYTATNGTSVVLSVAAAAGDEINVVAFKSFTTADMVSATNGGTFQSNVTVNGTMTATAFSGDGSALTNLPVSTPTLTSLGIPNHDQVTVTAGGAVTATSFSGDGSSLTGIPTPTLTSLGIANHDQVTVDGSGNVDVTGLVSLGGSTSRSINYRSGDNDILYEFDAGDFYRQNIGSSQHEFFTGNVNRMTITSAGVGIGTSPSRKLSLDGGAGTQTWTGYQQAGTEKFVVGLDASGNPSLYGTQSAPMIFYTNNTDRMTIDSSGRVTTPYQPSFSAYGSSYTNNTWGAIGGGNWSSVAHNIGSHFNSSNGRFTVPVAGRYIFTVSARAADNATSLGLAVRLRVNGNGGAYPPEIWGGNSYQGNGNRSGVSNTIIVSLGVNDYVEMGAWMSSVSGYRFAGHFLG